MTILRHALEDERHAPVAEGDPPVPAGPHDWLIANLRANGLLREAEAVRLLVDAQRVRPAAAPDGRLHADGHFTWARRDGYVMDRRLPCDFYLASAPARQALSQKAVVEAFCKLPHQVQYVCTFEAGVRFAESYYGIGGNGETV